MEIHKGLVGVTVDTTRISHVDGVLGRLVYRGYEIEELVDRPLMEVAHLVLFGYLPDPDRLELFSQTFAEYSELSSLDERILTLHAVAGHPMQALQGMAPLLHAPPSNRLDLDPEMAIGLAFCARLPVLVANLQNLRSGMAISPADLSLDYTDRFFKILRGRTCSEQERRLFESIQILQLEHGFNASTFTARVTSSTLAPMSSCLSAAIGSLYGRLHGGADQATLEMAEQVGGPEQAASYVDGMIARKERVMGMGHREYRVLDPRARIVKKLALELELPPDLERLRETLQGIEKRFATLMAERNKEVHPNLEFYKGLAYRTLGLAAETFTPCFAMARCFGWVAHVMESREDNRLVRPKSQYVGAMPEERKAKG